MVRLQCAVQTRGGGVMTGCCLIRNTHALALPPVICRSTIIVFWNDAQLSPWLPSELLSKLRRAGDEWWG